MSKIVYLFGAGSSANTLPIIREIPDRLETLLAFIKNDKYLLDSSEYFNDLDFKNAKNKKEYQKELIQSLQWLHDASRNHASIDTLAKKLSIKQESAQLKKLKIGLSIFFICEQALKNRDMRYDAFFASILNNSIKPPDNR